MTSDQLNVLGTNLELCSCNPMTGWFRDGACKADQSDIGEHTVCVIINKSFLSYSKALGNDLSSPIPQYGFPGLEEGDNWCLCASRWKQAYEDGMAPLVRLEATNITALDLIGIEILKQYAYKPSRLKDD